MKKPTKLSLRERNRIVKRQRAGKDRRKLILKKRRHSNKIKQSPHHPKKLQVKKISLPKQFDLHQNTDETLQKINEFREAVNKKNSKLRRLDFNEIKHIGSSSALMLAAEIDVWKSKISSGLFAQHKTWDVQVKALLCEMGFFELLGMPRLENKGSMTKNTVFLKFISGQKSEGDKAKDLREKIEQVIGKLEQKIHLFEGLTEAFTNTKQHAYDENNLKQHDKWWITASYKKDDKKLVVSMYDRGKSIPETMKTGKKWLFLDERKHKKDSVLIETAMEQSFKSKGTRSATSKTHRGKGLKQMLGFIKNKGELTIISKKGYCVFVNTGDKLETRKRKELQYSLQGTLIEWKINLLQRGG